MPKTTKKAGRTTQSTRMYAAVVARRYSEAELLKLSQKILAGVHHVADSANLGFNDVPPRA